MKPIKITAANRNAIDAALRAVNGSADTHTFAEAWEIERLVNIANADLARAHLPLSMHHGATFQAMSGEPVAKAYKRQRRATYVVLERRKTGWFLATIEPKDIWPAQGGTHRLVLKPWQLTMALQRFKESLHVAS